MTRDPGTLQGPDTARQLRRGDVVNWSAVRALFSLREGWTHLAAMYLASHPKPVAEAIRSFQTRIDTDPYWIEDAVVSDAEGTPLARVKGAVARYLGAHSREICLVPNTTSALALAYHGLIIRPEQEILTTTHEHYSHHESIRYAAARSGSGIRYVQLYERARLASVGEMVERVVGAIGPKTRAVGITWVHSSTGVKVPIASVAEAVARANRGRVEADRCLLIVDGVHGLGTQNADVGDLGCDFFASGLHKWLLGPRGTGVLWGRLDAWPALRPVVPSFDPDAGGSWDAWLEHRALPPSEAAFLSPGGFLAYEHLLAVPAALEIHEELGRSRVSARTDELNVAFREGAALLPNLTLHTPLDPELAAGISCFDVVGMNAETVVRKLAERKIRVSAAPYAHPLARVAAGIMNDPSDVERVLAELRRLG